MSRYIDADKLITELEKDESQFDKEAEEARNNPSAYTDGYADAMWSRANGIRDAMIEIRDAPSIDIVRCSECAYCNVQNTKYLYAICERHGIEFKPFEDDTRTHGCAWGSEKPNNSTTDCMRCKDFWNCDGQCDEQTERSE